MAEQDGYFEHVKQHGPYDWECEVCGDKIPPADVEDHEQREDAYFAIGRLSVDFPVVMSRMLQSIENADQRNDLWTVLQWAQEELK